MSVDDDRYIDLTRPGFLRGQLAEAEQQVIRREFSSCVEEVVGKINDGKEATVYLCRTRAEARVSALGADARVSALGADARVSAHESGGVGEYVAAKMYRARKFRAFANDSSYTNYGKLRDRRKAKMLTQRSRRGREAAHQLWIDHEWDVLNRLFEAGASVPQPHLRCEAGILMEFIGDDGAAAPKLAEVRLPQDAASDAFRQILRDVEILLDCRLVHGDLSAYNVLYVAGRTRLIDVPQAVSIDDAPDPWSLFLRDVTNICDFFRRRGVERDALDVALELWRP
jgi:RIO kinase 1